MVLLVRVEVLDEEEDGPGVEVTVLGAEFRGAISFY